MMTAHGGNEAAEIKKKKKRSLRIAAVDPNVTSPPPLISTTYY